MLAAFLLAACAGGSGVTTTDVTAEGDDALREEIAEAFESYFGPFLAGDAAAVQPHVSDACGYKDDFLLGVSEWDELVPDSFNLEVPAEALEFELMTPTRAKFALNRTDHPPLVNGKPLRPAETQSPVMFVLALEDGSWRLLNCDDPRVLGGFEE
jgi:hypothetical protein